MEKMVDRSGQPDECNSSKAQIRTLLEEQRQTILAEFNARVSHHELPRQLKPKKSADSFKDNYGNRNWNFVKLINEVLLRWKNYENFRVLHSTLWQDENSSRIRTLSWNSLAEYRNCKNEVNCMNDSKDFQDAEPVRSGNSHVTSRPVSFTPHPIPEGMLRHSFVTPCRREGPPSIWDTQVYRKTFFANPDASSSAPYPQELHQWNSSLEEPLHSSTVEKSERQEQEQDLRCQSGPTDKDSVILSGGDSSKNYGADQQQLQISDLHFDKFPTPATFAC